MYALGLTNSFERECVALLVGCENAGTLVGDGCYTVFGQFNNTHMGVCPQEQTLITPHLLLVRRINIPAPSTTTSLL